MHQQLNGSVATRLAGINGFDFSMNALSGDGRSEKKHRRADPEVGERKPSCLFAGVVFLKGLDYTPELWFRDEIVFGGNTVIRVGLSARRDEGPASHHYVPRF